LPNDPAQLAAATFDPAAMALRVVQATTGAPLSGDKIQKNATFFTALITQLKASSGKLRSGDLSQVEDMLMNQASALQAVFASLMERGLVTDDRGTLDLLLRYGLRAQAQCRATLETLASVKNPPVIYARQANVTTGPQQVNNGITRAGDVAGSKQNELSEEPHELHPDPRPPALESRADSPLAPVGTIVGAANVGRQGALEPQRLEGRTKRRIARPGTRDARTGQVTRWPMK
jgi:hypothetical protein